MSTATLERFPKTVSACHIEIIRLRKEIENVTEDDKSDEIFALETERDELKAKAEELEARVDELETENKGLEKKIEDWSDPVDAIDNFLYQVERPVGQFKFDVIHEPATDRAITRLYDAAKRQP